MEKLGNEVANGIGRFDCLPEDLLMSILKKIHDLKCLFQCTLVSKQFASKIYRIKAISLQLPAFDVDSIEAYTNMCHLFRGMFHFEDQETPKLLPPPSLHQKLKFTSFLQHFTELESAYFESACPRNPCTSPSLKWKAKLGNCGPAVQSLVSVLPTTMCVEAEYVSDEEEEFETIYEFLQHPAKGCLLFPLMCFAEWLVLVFSLIERHRSLKSVICSDSDKHGKFVLGDEQIVEWRKRLLCDDLLNDAIPRTVKMGWLPYLDLPISGYRMKGVFFVIMNFLSGKDALECDEMLDCWEYDEEEKVLGEAVRGILTNHPSVAVWMFHPW